MEPGGRMGMAARRRLPSSNHVREEVDDAADVPILSRDAFGITAVFKMGTGVPSLLQPYAGKEIPHLVRSGGLL